MPTIAKYKDQRNYYKPTFVNALGAITPRVYINSDLDLSSTVVTPENQLINTHLLLAGSISSVFPISAIAGTSISAINTPGGIAPYFVKQNELSKITPLEFERNLLLEFNTSFRNFNTSADLSDYLSDTFLPAITLNSPSDFLGTGVAAAHIYLIQELSWLYFLNQTGTAGPGIVRDLIIENFYRGQRIDLNDCMKAVTKFIWYELSANPTWSAFIPSNYTEGSTTWTSGTQNLDNLLVLNDIVYSPYMTDANDFTVRDAFDDYIDNQYFLDGKENAGPFWRLLKAYSYSMFDTYNQIDQIRFLNDLDSCPEEYLPYLAELIGWPLFGAEPERWRLQLVNAVDVYKKCGTKDSIQFALNSIFSEDVFNIATSISELWESYIPHLIYYALATESSHFDDLDSWTVSKANTLGVSGFSTTSLDENIRMAVDAIIYSTVLRFPEYFTLGGKPFPLRSSSFIFNYRGRNFPIPPWEEYPYYTRTETTVDMVDFIADRLVCFGVRNEFALQFAAYVKENTIDVDDDIRLNNAWLFFTSGYNEAPNLNNIVWESTSKKTEYLTLWSGKSSHFKATLNANDFDFSKDTIDSNSRETVSIAGKVLNEFAPAHSIPNLSLKLSALDDYITAGVQLPLLDFQKMDNAKALYGGSSLAGFMNLGVPIGAWKRNQGTGTVLGRSDFDSLTDSSFATSASVVAPRNNLRRRNLKFLMPKNTYYDRTGFNSPISWDVSCPQSKYLPLGFIPSALAFESNPSADVYGYCQTLGSNQSFYGVAVSDTYPTRGWRTLQSNAKMIEYGSEPDYYVDHGQLDEIYYVMWKCLESKKYWETYLTLSADGNLDTSAYDWKDVLQSSANQVEGPTSVYDFYNFEFGRDIHKLFGIYTSLFEKHTMRMDLLDLDGPNIFAHTFGSIFRNSKFDKFGSNNQYISDTLSSLHAINNSLLISTGEVASSTSSMYVGRYERRDHYILSGVELVITSGSSDRNYFNVIHLDGENRKSTQSEYMFDKTFVLSKAIDGLPRIRFDLQTYGNPSAEGHPFNTNFLVPEHDFNFKVKALASNDNGTSLGGMSMGVWIHTKSENGLTWTYTPAGEWVRHSSLISKENLFNLYAHSKYFADKTRVFGVDASGGSRFQCLEVPETSGTRAPVLTSFTEDEFETFEIGFNTRNKPISVPEDYYKNIGQQVHRTSQNYIVEVFAYPSTNNADKFLLFDSINLVDSTLNKWSQYLAAGIPSPFPVGPRYCQEFREVLSREDIRTILTYFNELAVGIANRVGDDSEINQLGTFQYGGSRLDYREYPGWIITASGSIF